MKNKEEVLTDIENNLKEAEKIIFKETLMDKRTEALYYINMAILECKVWRDSK